jgi:hypothetical protein
LTLSDGQLVALRNLSQKKAGAVVGWIGIAEARGLTDLGLAARTAAGWRITPSGEETLMREDRVVEVENIVALQQPLPIRPRHP